MDLSTSTQTNASEDEAGIKLTQPQALFELHKVLTYALDEAGSIKEAINITLEEVCTFAGWPAGHAYRYYNGVLRPTNCWYLSDPEHFAILRSSTEDTALLPGDGSLPGRVFDKGTPAWIPDISADPFLRRSFEGTDFPVRTAFALPVWSHDRVVAVLEFFSHTATERDAALLADLSLVGIQLGRVFERAHSRRTIHEREGRLQALMETAVEAIVMVDNNGIIIGWNRGGTSIFGYEKSEVIGQPLTLLMPEQYRAAHLAGLKRLNRDDHPRILGRTFEIEGLRKDGEPFPLELSLSTWRVGGRSYFASIMRDISERRQAELALREQEEQTRLLFSAVKDAILLVDAETYEILDANDASSQMYGYTRKELLEMKALELSAQPNTSKANLEQISNVNTFADLVLNDSLHRRKDGTHVPVEITAGQAILRGRPVICAVVRDVTERKRAAQAVEASRLQLRRLAARIEAVREEERTRLSREVHDVLGQALTGLNMDISVIEKELPPGQDSIEERLEEMKEALQEMVQVVRRIAHDLRPGILDDLGLIAALEWETEKFASRTQFDCSFEESVDYIVLDRERATSIFRVFQEILTNIVRHAEATMVSVSVTKEEENLVVRVVDNGRGIQEEDLNNSTSLGLLGMRERLYPWKGRVMFKGSPDQGTTVTVTVPLSHPQAA